MNPDEIKAMTLNERLIVCNLIDDFDVAVRNKNKNKLKELLNKVFVEPDQTDQIINNILSNPAKYGY